MGNEAFFADQTSNDFEKAWPTQIALKIEANELILKNLNTAGGKDFRLEFSGKIQRENALHLSEKNLQKIFQGGA